MTIGDVISRNIDVQKPQRRRKLVASSPQGVPSSSLGREIRLERDRLIAQAERNRLLRQNGTNGAAERNGKHLPSYKDAMDLWRARRSMIRSPQKPTASVQAPTQSATLILQPPYELSDEQIMLNRQLNPKGRYKWEQSRLSWEQKKFVLDFTDARFDPHSISRHTGLNEALVVHFLNERDRILLSEQARVMIRLKVAQMEISNALKRHYMTLTKYIEWCDKNTAYVKKWLKWYNSLKTNPKS
jgi:hypothetical protein